MKEIQRFGLENIYCSSRQDRQFAFKMVRVTKAKFPVKRIAQVYSVSKPLPDNTSSYHVFVIGNIPPMLLNLLRQNRDWYRDYWVNLKDDINERNYIGQIYNDDGVMFPREYIHYSFIDESSLIIAIKADVNIKRKFDIDSFKYFRVYSNSYFNTLEYNGLPVKNGIKIHCGEVAINAEKVSYQNLITNYKVNGGDVIIYVNGYYTDNLNLNIPDYSYVEVIYDQSIISKEKYDISSLRTFDSIKDNKLKYLLFREKIVDYIQYEDDNEIYISNDNELVTKGLYYYEHSDYSSRNVTDKDYSLSSNFINNQAVTLSNLTTGGIPDKILVLYTRRSGINKPLVYSSLKLHELYKLPQEVERDVISNVNYSLNELRAETLENSDYFKLASANCLRDVTKELCTAAVGYNGIKYYYGYTPSVVENDLNISVPMLYSKESYAYEYDLTGLLLQRHTTNGPMYTCSSSDVKYVEFLQGITPTHYEKLYTNNETATLRDSEYKILSAYFQGISRISNWEDITNNSLRVSYVNNEVTFNEEDGKLIKIHYLDQPLTLDLELPLVDGTLFFPIYVEEDRGLGVQKYNVDIPYLNLEVFLNGRRLTDKIDYFINYPYISICNKLYLDHTKEKQNIHIRLHGYTLDKAKINSNEISGFVNNGVLTRNNYYDIRDDKVFSVFIKGKLYNRSNVIFAENDNTVRAVHPFNGLPYSVVEHQTLVKDVCGLDSLPIYEKNKEIDIKISQLYNNIFPEPDMNQFNTISDHWYLFSPIVAKIIYDMLDGNISPSLYMTPYNDETIHNLLNENPYKLIYDMDPIRKELPYSIVELHPTPYGDIVSLSLHQYRFITNVIRIITNGKPERINISGYVSVTATQTVGVETPMNIGTGGIIVL